MGQTLTHGVYLPNEGERNCYNGLASNWRLLDGAIGTVAAHTTAIAEKADISHTHGNITNDGKVGTDANKPLITGTDGVIQAGSFGNSANTFCEGNDSRLSDARTPVAHTHTKSDVTDLLNSNFIPSANNSYDLGSSSYQWNNLYAKNYYYNGTAWGLDKANTWTGNNTFTSKTLFHVTEDPTYVLKSSTMQEGVVPSENRTAYTGSWQDKNSNVLGYGRFSFYSTALIQAYEVNLRNKATNASFDPNGSRIQSGFQLVLYPSGNSELKIYAHTLPNGNGVWNLGDSTHKWKTLNGINPGALSLPNLTANSPATQNPPNGWISIDTTDWDKTGNLISYIPPVDGWISIITDNSSATNYIRCTYDNGNILAKANGNGYAQGLSVFLPVLKNVQIGIRLVCTTIGTAKLYPCQGNV